MSDATQALTVIAPIDPHRVAELRAILAAIHARIQKDMPPAAMPDTHFTRFVVLEDKAGELPPVLAWEANHDGRADAYLRKLAGAPVAARLDAIFACCLGWPDGGIGDVEGFVAFALRRSVRAAAFYAAYRGVPKTTVDNDGAVHAAIQNVIDEPGARARLTAIGDHGKIRADIAARVAATHPGLDVSVGSDGDARSSLLAWKIPLIALGVVVALALLPVLIVLAAAFFVVWLPTLRRREASDDAPDPPKGPVYDTAGHQKNEDNHAQNELTHLVDIKPGFFRLFTVWIVLTVIDVAARLWFVRGDLNGITSIHFARWVILLDPRERYEIPAGGHKRHRLLFFSNYDGSWESYLGEFIDRASDGLTAIWSNTDMFPRTKDLVGEGSRDEELFKQWTRDHQVRTDVWWTGVPKSTVQNVRDNIWLKNHLRDGESDATAWLARLGGGAPDGEVVPEDAPAPAESPDDLHDIQDLVYRAHKGHAWSAFVFARLATGAGEQSRAWLAKVRDDVTPASRPRGLQGGRVHLAIAPSGLVKLGLPEVLLDGFPQEARDGMASRGLVLRDDNPGDWELGGAGEDRQLDVLVMLYARTRDDRDAMVRTHRAALETAGAHVYDTEGGFAPDSHEQFGFADGLAQPYLVGIHDKPHPGQKTLATGEVLLGYTNAYGKKPASPTWTDGSDLGRNGTYLVFRKLSQEVPRLWTWIRERAKDLVVEGDKREPELIVQWLGAKVMGRWCSGASLVRTWDKDDASFSHAQKVEAFSYLGEDISGMRCPISAHVRRANPRDARSGDSDDSNKVVGRHRIIRRGRAYGPRHGDPTSGAEDGEKRGLYFISLQASIARGFEFIQQTWLGNPGFHGLAREVDPIMGNANAYADGDDVDAFTIPAEPYRYRLPDVPDVVKVLGGGYFFLPSLSALDKLARGPTN